MVGLDSPFCWCPHYLGIQDASHHGNVHHRGGVHSPLHDLKGGHSNDGDAQGSMRARAASQLPAPKVHCTVFEDNSGALELARFPKIHPQTKHINQSFHHFREHVARQDIIIKAMPMDQQMANILNKPLAETAFECHCKAIMGW